MVAVTKPTPLLSLSELQAFGRNTSPVGNDHTIHTDARLRTLEVSGKDL
jgi:hypothetical protein